MKLCWLFFYSLLLEKLKKIKHVMQKRGGAVAAGGGANGRTSSCVVMLILSLVIKNEVFFCTIMIDL